MHYPKAQSRALTHREQRTSLYNPVAHHAMGFGFRMAFGGSVPATG